MTKPLLNKPPRPTLHLKAKAAQPVLVQELLSWGGDVLAEQHAKNVMRTALALGIDRDITTTQAYANALGYYHRVKGVPFGG